MARVVIEIEDEPDGGLRVHFYGDELRCADTLTTNTAAQNAAIHIALAMREVGLNAPDLSGK